MDNKVNVVIGGEIITLRSSETADYLQRLARYADEKISEIKSKSKAAALDDRARSLIIALNIADDYFKAMEKLTVLVPKMKKLQEENAAISAEMKEMKAELAGTKAELAEFIKSFDAENPAEGENILTMPQTMPQAKRKAR